MNISKILGYRWVILVLFLIFVFGGEGALSAGNLDNQQIGEHYEIFISGDSGSDGSNCGSSISNACRTLYGAYERINFPGTSSYNVILVSSETPINVHSNPDTDTLEWVLSGSEQWPIKIYSYESVAILTRNNNQASAPLIKFSNVSYISIVNVRFENATVGISFDNCDDCSLEKSQIVGSDSEISGSGSGAVWIGKSNGWNADVYRHGDGDQYENEEEDEILRKSQSSDNVRILDNHIYNQHINENDRVRYHAIYVSQGVRYAKIERNYIEVDSESGSGITLNREKENNDIKYNVVSNYFGDNSESNRFCILLGHEESIPDQTDYISDNKILNNYLWGGDAVIWKAHCDGASQLLSADHPSLCATNIAHENENVLLLGSHGEKRIRDGRWAGYPAGNISRRVVSGDFDLDGELDDIAAFYDYGNNETRIHVWLASENRTFIYQGSSGWWSDTGYDATKIDGRIVSGDFDGDGIKNEIAAFYDYSNIETRIHVWKSDGNRFVYSGGNGRWSSPSSSVYNANKITKRMVSGDFDGDGKEDDLAAFYDYGYPQSRIHIWLGNNNEFIYQGSNGWWFSTGYPADKISGRVVAGDFDNDGFVNDIAAFYDYGGGETRIHVWRSINNSFVYSGSGGWWTGIYYEADKITDRIVVGDFDQDNLINDIAAFYDFGANGTRLHSWYSSGTASFIHTDTRWRESEYSSDQITGRVVTGSFSKQNFLGDILGIYDTSEEGGVGVRMHIWRGTSDASILDSLLGYPWQY